MKPHKVWGETFGYQKRYRLVCWDCMKNDDPARIAKELRIVFIGFWVCRLQTPSSVECFQWNLFIFIYLIFRRFHNRITLLILFLITPAVSFFSKHDVSTGLVQPFSSMQQKKKTSCFEKNWLLVLWEKELEMVNQQEITLQLRITLIVGSPQYTWKNTCLCTCYR